MSPTLHVGDLPDGVGFGATVAVDTETLGLNPHRDRLCLVHRLCLVQSRPATAPATWSSRHRNAPPPACHLVQFRAGANGAIDYSAANLKRVLGDPGVLKLFHYARFDIAVLHRYLGVAVAPLYCTKIASRLTRTYTDRHGLEDLCRELLGIDLSKRQQSSDWARAELSEAQIDYAARDVLHLHGIKAILDAMLDRESRRDLAEACFAFLPTRAALDLGGWPEMDIFAH